MKNLPNETKKQTLIEEINAAFDGVSREDGVTFHEARIIDYCGSAAERAEARKSDNEERWQDVPEKLLASREGVLYFLDPKGFRYYAPAYMVCYLRSADFRISAADDIVMVLDAGPTERNSRRFQLPRFQIFTPEQSRVIAHFLVFEAEEQTSYAQQALDNYWGNFSESHNGF